MAMKQTFVSGCLLLCSVLCCQAMDGGQLDSLKRTYRLLLLSTVGNEEDAVWRDFVRVPPETQMSDQVVIELHQRYPFDLDKISFYLSSQTEEGGWKDINYKDTKRSGWEPKRHVDRILELSKLYYSEGTPYFRSEEVKACIHRALQYWFKAGLQCKNWWYNQIGVPKALGEAFILLEEQLSEEEKNEAIRAMQVARIGMTGQNKVWLAGNVLIRALLDKDEQLVKEARDAIVSEVVLGREEGIQPDWSFHQHGPQMQFGNYGLSFVTSMSFYYRLFRETDYRFSSSQADILFSLVKDGYQWVIWNLRMDVNALGRQLFHNAQLHKAYGLAFAAATLGLGDAFPLNGNLLIGHKHFDYSDYTVHRTASWMASVRMSSRRVINTERVNEDNLKGYYLGDGATYYYRNGNEYLNVFPFWDWRKIPGVTAYSAAAPLPDIARVNSQNRTYKVGGVTDGRNGMSAMELKRDKLHAYKSWLFTDRFVVCMGAGIAADTSLAVTTSIEQSLKQGDFEVWNGNNWEKKDGNHAYTGKDLRFFHNRTGYIVLSGDTCVAGTERRTGRWSDFMKMYRPEEVTGEVASLYLCHGVRPAQKQYLYIVCPAVDKGFVSSFDLKSVEVIQNDSIAQVLFLPEKKQCWAAVYHPCTIAVKGKALVADTPGMYCWTEKKGQFIREQKKEFLCR